MDAITQTGKDWSTWLRLEPQMFTRYGCDPQTGARSAIEWIESFVPEDARDRVTDLFYDHLSRLSGKSVNQLEARWPAGTKVEDHCAALKAAIKSATT